MCGCHSIVVVCRNRAPFIFACTLASVSKPKQNVNKPNDRWTMRGHLVVLYLIIAHSDVSRTHAHSYIRIHEKLYVSLHSGGIVQCPRVRVSNYAFTEAADRAIINNKRFGMSVINTQLKHSAHAKLLNHKKWFVFSIYLLDYYVKLAPRKWRTKNRLRGHHTYELLTRIS